MDTTQTEISRLERLRLEAAVSADIETLDRLLHPQLAYAHSNGARDGKDALLAHIQSSHYTYRWIETSDENIVIENGVALITAVQDAEILVGPNLLRIHNSTLSVWTNVDDQWRLIAYQPTVLPAEKIAS